MITRRRFLEHCGQCAIALAVGGDLSRALAARNARGAAGALEVAAPDALGVERWTRTACDLCGLGEPVFIGTQGGGIAAVKGIARSTLGFGRLCPRARALVAPAVTADRAVKPLVRRDRATKGTLEGLEPATWAEALAVAARGLGDARARLGPEGIAVLASDAETCETYGLLSRILRLGVGSDHLDTAARLDALHAYEAARATFGIPANPGAVDDIDAATLIVLIGGEIADSHPALFYRALDARRTQRATVVLIDARRTEAAALADLHLRPWPGRELDVVNALAARLLPALATEDAGAWLAWLRGAGTGAPPRARDPLAAPNAASSSRFSVESALRAARVDATALARLVERWKASRNVVTLVGPMALDGPSGGALARAVVQLHRATGQWGQPGRGAILLPRGGNATGVLAFGIAPGLLPAGMRLANEPDRARYAAAAGVPADALPRSPGLSALEWPAAAQAGRLGAIVAHRANPAAEFPDALAWRAALTQAFTIVTTTHVPSESTLFADVVLPVALVVGESAGTIMTLDRRCVTLERACAAPGEARGAGRILSDLFRPLVDPTRFAALAPPDDEMPFAEWDRWRALSQGTPFEAQGISPQRLGRDLDVPWPCAAETEPGLARLAAAGAMPASYAPTPAAAPDAPSVERPLLLLLGPLREHQGSRVRTGRTPELHYEAPSAQLEMHPDDARALSLADGDWVTVESETGAATVRLWLTDRVEPGMVFLPEHFGCLSDAQGGSATQKEPEGLGYRLASSRLVAGTDAPAGLRPWVSVRAAHRRDMRQRGV